MKFFATLEKQKNTWFLLFASLIFFFLRFPSLFEPYWYGDEGIYEVIGLGLRNGRLLYTGIWDNKPPLLYYIYGLFAGDQFSVRLFSLIVGILTLIVFFFLAKAILQPTKEKYLWITTSIFGFLFATPLIEGNIANAENFMLLPIFLAGLLVWKITQRKTTLQLWLPGLLLGIAFLIKVVAVFDFAAFFLFIFCISYTKRNEILIQIKRLIPFIVGFIIPLLIIMAMYLVKGNLGAFIQSAFQSNVGYVGYGNTFIIPQGLLLLKLLILGIFVLYLFLKRNKIQPAYLFMYLWTGFSLFNMLFSQRPYTHYMLVLLGSFSLVIGLLLTNKKLRGFTLIIFLIAIIIVAKVFGFPAHANIGKSLFGYYGNFITYITGHKSTHAYDAFFDQGAVRDVELAEFINGHKNADTKLFIWGNNGQVYKLTNILPPGRYIVAYHITSSAKTLAETYKDLLRVKPQFIIMMPSQGPMPFSLPTYQPRFTINGATIYEKIL